MDNEITIKVKKLHPDAVIPKYSHDGDVCMDLTAIGLDYDAKNDMYIYHTGLAFESDSNIGQFLFLRSSNCKTDAYLCNGVGVADSAIYRGEIQLRMKNRRPTLSTMKEERQYELAEQVFKNVYKKEDPLGLIDDIASILMSPARFSDSDIEKKALELAPYKVGDRVGQMVFMQYPTVKLIEVDELSDSERGAGGFGSTGK